MKDAIVKWIRDWFAQNGGDNATAVIGMSGGKDSTICAALCLEALGKERVFGMIMPNYHMEDEDIAKQVCRYLDLKYSIYDIGPAVKTVTDHFADNYQIRTNVPARLRMTHLYAMATLCNGRVVNTSNFSEAFVGYSTKWGDGAGDFSPLGNLTVTEVIAIGKEYGLPKEFYNKAPSDGMSGKTDEDNFGFTYEVLDRYIRTEQCPDAAIREKIDAMHKRAAHKVEKIPAYGDDQINSTRVNNLLRLCHNGKHMWREFSANQMVDQFFNPTGGSYLVDYMGNEPRYRGCAVCGKKQVMKTEWTDE